jgi:hypothetical protein
MLELARWFSVALALASLVGQTASIQSDPRVMFAQLGLTAGEQKSIDAGRPVAKVLPWGGPSEVFVLGVVYIEASPDAYLKAARDVGRLARTPGYIAIGELPATLTDMSLATLTLDPDDIKALRSCKEGDCDVQLPTRAIQAFRDAVNWSQPDAASQANALARGMILDLVREYRRGGNAALGVYRDKQHPARVADQFERMVSRSIDLPEALPNLRRYLLQYPNVDLPGADSFFYWEKVDFGMKPTVRVNHGVICRAPGGVSAVAIKQLYASHYFHTALDVSVCVPETAKPGRRGFYLITLKASEQEGLTGLKGSTLRKIAIGRIRSSLETALAVIKSSLEHAPAAVR